MERQTLDNSGYIILLSVLVIGAVIGSLAIFNLSFGLTSREIAQLIQDTTQARALAETCIESGLLQIKTSDPLTLSDTRTFEYGTCSYTIESLSASTSTLTASSQLNAITRQFLVTVGKEITGSTTSILSVDWQEI